MVVVAGGMSDLLPVPHPPMDDVKKIANVRVKERLGMEKIG